MTPVQTNCEKMLKNWYYFIGNPGGGYYLMTHSPRSCMLEDLVVFLPMKLNKFTLGNILCSVKQVCAYMPVMIVKNHKRVFFFTRFAMNISYVSLYF